MPSDSEAALSMKFLEVCQELTSKGIPFTCTLTIGSTINLSLDTKGKEMKEESTIPLARKKFSPSTTRRNARRKALYLEKKEKEKQFKEKSKAAENTTAADKSGYKELEDKDSRRITTAMKNQRDKSVAEVEDPPEKLPQLDGKEDRNETDEDDDEEYQSEQVSEIEIVKGALDKYILSLDPETLKNQPVKEISDLKMAVSNIIRRHLKC